MPHFDTILTGPIVTGLCMLVVAAPFALVAILGVPSLLGFRVSEPITDRSCRVVVTIGLLSCAGVLISMLATGDRHIVLDLGDWVAIRQDGGDHAGHYHFDVKFEFDRLSVPLAMLSFTLCGTIGAFAVKYMHREAGYNRFFMLYAVFLLGMVTASLADTIETLFMGWELVGLSSVLLIAYFQERPAPVRNGLRVWVVYRVSDAALLLAAVVLHHMSGEGDFDKLMGTRSWPYGHTDPAATPAQINVVGFLLLLAAAGKSALVPFSGWLPRAMEGPTPSSAVFYGALSVHLGAFLLLRMSPLIAASVWLASAVVALGLITAVYSSLTGSVQTDIKCALSFASLTQVGLIVAEIGLGHWVPFLWYIALAHLLGHACLRVLQFVRAPTLLQDYRQMENAIGERLSRPAGPAGSAPSRVRMWLYRFALERGYLDSFLAEYVARPFIATFQWFDALEHRWTRFLAGPARTPAFERTPAPETQQAA